MITPYLFAAADHLWQSTLFIGLAWLASRALRKNSARIRHWIWLSSSIKFLIPFSLLVAIGGRFEWRTPPAIAQPALTMIAGSIGPFAEQVPLPFSSDRSPAEAPVSSRGLVFVLGIWLSGFAVVILSWLRGWRMVRRAL